MVWQDEYHYGPFPIPYPWQDAANVGPTLEAARRYHFDYAVRSAWTFTQSYGVSAPPATMPAWRPAYPVDEVCSTLGTRVAAFRDPYFGPFEIYKLNW